MNWRNLPIRLARSPRTYLKQITEAFYELIDRLRALLIFDDPGPGRIYGTDSDGNRAWLTGFEGSEPLPPLDFDGVLAAQITYFEGDDQVVLAVSNVAYTSDGTEYQPIIDPRPIIYEEGVKSIFWPDTPMMTVEVTLNLPIEIQLGEIDFRRGQLDQDWDDLGPQFVGFVVGTRVEQGKSILLVEHPLYQLKGPWNRVVFDDMPNPVLNNKTYPAVLGQAKQVKGLLTDDLEYTAVRNGDVDEVQEGGAAITPDTLTDGEWTLAVAPELLITANVSMAESTVAELVPYVLGDIGLEGADEDDLEFIDDSTENLDLSWLVPGPETGLSLVRRLLASVGSVPWFPALGGLRAFLEQPTDEVSDSGSMDAQLVRIVPERPPLTTIRAVGDRRWLPIDEDRSAAGLTEQDKADVAAEWRVTRKAQFPDLEGFEPLPVDVLSVISVDPNSGPPEGGTEVTITGTGFEEGATVTFGGEPATNVVVVNSTTITCETPEEPE